MELGMMLYPSLAGVEEEGRMLKKKGEILKKSDEESFEPEYHQIKKMGIKVNKTKITVGEWNYQENQVYLQFMIDNTADFLSERTRRKTKVFYRLSKILKKRTPDQCRSHHQKLQLKYKDDLFSIIGEVHRKIQKSIAQEFVDYQHRLRLESIQKMKELSRTGEQEAAPPGTHVVSGGWFQIQQRGNCFRISISEEDVDRWQADL